MDAAAVAAATAVAIATAVATAIAVAAQIVFAFCCNVDCESTETPLVLACVAM